MKKKENNSYKNVRALHDKILVRPVEQAKVTEGGIHLAESFMERPSKAVVLAVGEGVKDRPMEIKVGDVVLHIKNAGTPHEIDGETLYFLRDVDCHGFERAD